MNPESSPRRAPWLRFANKLVWVVGMLGVIFLSNAIQRFAPVWRLSDNAQVGLLLAGIAALIALGVVADRWLRGVIVRKTV